MVNRRNFGLALGMLMAVALTAGALILSTQDRGQKTQISLQETGTFDSENVRNSRH